VFAVRRAECHDESEVLREQAAYPKSGLGCPGNKPTLAEYQSRARDKIGSRGYTGKRWGTLRKEYWETRSSGATWLSAGCVTSRIPNTANDNVELLRLGRRIQAERKLLGLTQNGFARDCGLNRSHFGGIERGERNLTFVVLCKICKQLRCDIANVTRGIPRSSYVRDT
jgi:DNA-binding XRE family transcriptional regulator